MGRPSSERFAYHVSATGDFYVCTVYATGAPKDIASPRPEDWFGVASIHRLFDATEVAEWIAVLRRDFEAVDFWAAIVIARETLSRAAQRAGDVSGSCIAHIPFDRASGPRE